MNNADTKQGHCGMDIERTSIPSPKVGIGVAEPVGFVFAWEGHEETNAGLDDIAAHSVGVTGNELERVKMCYAIGQDLVRVIIGECYKIEEIFDVVPGDPHRPPFEGYEVLRYRSATRTYETDFRLRVKNPRAYTKSQIEYWRRTMEDRIGFHEISGRDLSYLPVNGPVYQLTISAERVREIMRECGLVLTRENEIQDVQTGTVCALARILGLEIAPWENV